MVIAIVPFLILLAVTVIDAKANPYSFRYISVVATPEDIELPTISLASPLNGTVSATDTITLSFRITTNTSKHTPSNDSSYAVQGLTHVSYKLDWQRDNVSVFESFWPALVNKTVVCKTTLSEIPEGRHCMNVTAFAYGLLTKLNSHYTLDYYPFYMNTSSSVYFTIDKTPPNIVIQQPLNETYDATNVLLMIAVEEPVAWMRYSLDGQKNITTTGNTTLPTLSVGLHTLTVYANDTAGNTASSKRISFMTREPFPWLPATAVLVVAAAVVAIVAAVYLKKRKSQSLYAPKQTLMEKIGGQMF